MFGVDLFRGWMWVSWRELAQMPEGRQLDLPVGGGAQLSLIYLGKPQSSFECTGGPWSVLYTPSAWRPRAASVCASSGEDHVHCAWVCGLHKLCRLVLQESFHDCPYQRLQVVVNCLYGFPAAARVHWWHWCHCVPAGTAFLPAFQEGMCGLFSTQLYSQIMQFPLLCNCKEMFLEVLCFSTWSFSQIFFLINQKLITLWACDAMCSIDSLIDEGIVRKKPTQTLVSQYCCIEVFFCLLIFTFCLHSSHCILSFSSQLGILCPCSVNFFASSSFFLFYLVEGEFFA